MVGGNKERVGGYPSYNFLTSPTTPSLSAATRSRQTTRHDPNEAITKTFEEYR